MSGYGAGRGGRPDGELIVTGGGQRIAGWTSVAVSRGLERIPGSFELACTSRNPSELRGALNLNDPVTLSIGGQTVLTGYLERLVNRMGEGAHDLTYVGRGRCCDLVDGAALIDQQTRNAVSVTALARALVAPYAGGAIKVLAPDGDGDQKVFDQLSVNLGESPYELIERIARYEGLLVYEDADGNLVLSRVGTRSHGSGFIEGGNVQDAEFTLGIDQRFDRYIPLVMASDTISRDGQAVGAGNQPGEIVRDPGVNRYRPRIIVSEQAIEDTSLAARRAQWEMVRRIGRSYRLTLTADSWLDADGAPWTPNRLAPVTLPSFGLDQLEWIIADVQFRRDGQGGTTAVVSLMPPDAFRIAPSQLNALDARRLIPGPADAALGPASAPVPPASAPNAGGSLAGARVNLHPPAQEGSGL